MEDVYTRYLQQNTSQADVDAITLLEMMVFIEACGMTDELNEGVLDSVKSIGKAIGSVFDKKVKSGAKKLGVHIGTEKGLIQYIGLMGLNSAKLLYYAVDYVYNGNKSAKDKIIEIGKSVKKEQIIDFILKLDVLTLHMLTEPIHIIDSLTGMHIGANIEAAGKEITLRAKDAIISIEKLKNKLEDKLKVKLQIYANALRNIFDIGGFKGVNESITTTDIEHADINIGKFQKRLKNKSCKRRRRVSTKTDKHTFICFDDIMK